MRVLTLAFVAMWVAGAGAQSLGDVARKEAERRKTVKAPGKTYTNDQLKAEPAGPARRPRPLARPRLAPRPRSPADAIRRCTRRCWRQGCRQGPAGAAPAAPATQPAAASQG